MKNRIILLIITATFLLPVKSIYAAISSVTLTPASPTTLSNGNSYYLSGVYTAGTTYSFRVQAVDTAATGKAYWNQITISFPSGTETITISIDTDSVVAATGLEIPNPVTDIIDNTSSYTNLDYTITIRFLWTAGEYAAAANNIQATVSNDIPQSMTDTRSVNHGVCSSINVVNFAQSGVAADGYVNPWHNTFNVTGAIVYNVAGATVADAVVTRDPGEISAANQIVLLLDGNPTAIVNGGTTTNFTFSVTNAIGLTLGNHRWRMRATMVTGGAVEESPNVAPYYLALNCDRVQITAISFTNGGGVNAPEYYRNVNIPGTQIQITAQRENGGGAMIGDTTITVRNTDQNYFFNVSIQSGQNTGIRNVPSPNNTDFAAGTTQETEYQIVYVTSGAYGDTSAPAEGTAIPAPAFGQNSQARILTPQDGGTITNTPVYDIRAYWDRSDPVGNNVASTVFTGWVGYEVTATSIRFNWQAVTALGDPPWDGDFYTYRIYYKLSTDTVWKIIDRSTPNYGPAEAYDLSNPATVTATIIGLQPFTQYDYFITAVDVFGQEVSHPLNSTSNACYDRNSAFNTPTDNGYDRLITNPTSIEASVTDGITNYTNAQFAATITASTRPLRKSSIRITIYIATSGDQPDNVNIILAQDDGAGNGSPAGDLYPLASAPLYERIECSKSAPNTWQGFIPSSNQFLTEGSSCRFIIEIIRSSIATYSDVNAGIDANDFEYTFMVQTPTKFTPWPTRVLNNVITDKNPLCYPSYYLSDDAFVTIKAYDVKGRPVATLLDNSFRKGGQNIKEGGWAGDNKARRKLGVGLYYLRFEAKRARDGKMILNQTEKVVIAK